MRRSPTSSSRLALLVLAAALLGPSPARAEERFPRQSRAALRLHVRDEVQLTGDGTDRGNPRRFARELPGSVRAALTERGFTVVTGAAPGVVEVQLGARISTGWAPIIWSYEFVDYTTATFEKDGVVVASLRGPPKDIERSGTSYTEGAGLLASWAAGNEALAAAAAQDASPVAARASSPSSAAARWRAAVRRESRLAVLEFRGAFPPEILGALSDEARGAALEATAQIGCTVMTRESLATILRDMGRSAQCAEGECEVDVARSIGADLVVSGDVMTVDGTHLLTMKLHESAKGALLATARAKASTSLALIEAVRPATATLFGGP